MMIPPTIRQFLLLVMGTVCLASCSSESKTTSPPTAEETTAPLNAEDLIPAGALMDDRISYEFAIYYLPAPADDPLEKLDRLLEGEFSSFQRVDELDENTTQMLVQASLHTTVQDDYLPPDLNSLQYFGRGVTREQAIRLQDSKSALILDFIYPKEKIWSGLRSACELMHALARDSEGLIWDEEARLVFSPDAWREKRLAGWTEEFPVIADHIAVHAYNSGEYVRAVSLGMTKFGLPDVVIEEFPWSLNRTLGHIINLWAQAMAEGATIKTDGQFDLELKAIKNKHLRELQRASLKENATGRALLMLRKGVWEEGDPQNRLIEIGFDRYSGKDLHARQNEMASQMFGWEDSINYIEHDDELRAASQRAKHKLPMLQNDFQSGLEPGEFIQVKAPFETPDGGREWMWVEITEWKGDTIRGLLKNEPFNIPDLQGGQKVTVRQSDVFDYIRRFPDGRTEGNETGKIIQKSQSQP